MEPDEERYSRNIALFGIDGQRRVAQTKVAIVGLGGLGSHVAQQLAYLGVLDYGLIDDDVVTTSSLNRLVGAVDADAKSAVSKVAVAERVITAIQPRARVQVLKEELNDQGGAGFIKRATVVFGCLDRDLPRLRLTELCARFATPYVDLATDVGGEGWYGGRVVVCDGTRCLFCLPDLLDQEQIRQDTMSPQQRAADDRIYGVDRKELAGTGPAVVSLNGVVASLAVTEFLALVTGLRPPAGQLTYRGDLSRVTTSLDKPRAGCWYCTELWRRG